MLPSGGSRNCSAGGLYTECTITPDSSTVMNSILSSTDRNAGHRQTISNKNRSSMFIMWTSSY